MLFHNFFHNGQTQTGTFFPIGDVWLGQALAPFGRQTNAIVADIQYRVLPLDADFDFNDTLGDPAAIGRQAGSNRFLGVLQKIGQQPVQMAIIASDLYRAGG